MLTLIRDAEVFAPTRLGRRDVLLAGHRIAEVDASITLRGAPLEVVDAAGQWLLPGFVDALTHPCGGGGEGGFGNRTAEIDAGEFIRAGVTTPVGALGTDSVTRSLDVLYGKVMELRARGLSARMLNGSYRLPVVTLTGDVVRDLVLIEPLVGTGEVAISDLRSSQPDVSELRRLAADAHLGGTLSGKRGTVLVHVGDGEQGLAPIEQALAGSDLPRWIFYPTHVNRSRKLLNEAVRFVSAGGFADITVSTTEHLIDAGEVPALQALREAIDTGAPPRRLTLSSDAGGSLPLYRGGELAGLKSAGPMALLQALWTAIRSHPALVEAVVGALTRNPAEAYGLKAKGRVEPGADADLVLLDPGTGQLSEVYCAGRPLLRSGASIHQADSTWRQGAEQ